MKKIVKVLSVLLAVCFCFSAIVFIVGAKAGDVAQGDTFSFGSYPQSLVKDEALLEKLKVRRAFTKKDVIVIDGRRYYASQIQNDMFLGEASFACAYGYAPDTTYWFEFEPIQWRVLEGSASSKDGSVLLMAENVLDTHAFNETVRGAGDNTWDKSDVRAWLNGTFLNTAFTAKEQAFLLSSDLTNEPNPVYGTYNGRPSPYAGAYSGGYPYVGTSSGGDTTDKVFLPSFNEITNWEYGFNIGWKDKKGDFGEPVCYYETDTEPGEHAGRNASGTDYAKSQGLWANVEERTNDEGEVVYRYPVKQCRYWLRTAGMNPYFAAGVIEDGRVSTGWYVDYQVVGIRPMIRVKADAVRDTSPYFDTEYDGMPFHIQASDTEFYYRQRDVQFTVVEPDVDVTWDSSDPRIADIDPETGEVTIHRVGTVTITATSKVTGETVEFQMEITYQWWQQMIRIFLFGWIWY